MSAQGIITSIAGNGVTQYIGDGSPATNFSLAEPTGMCRDKNGDMLISDRNNIRIRKLTPSGIISTIIGDGTLANNGDNGPATAAHFGYPNGICIDTAGNYYITDGHYNVIRRVDAVTGIITTVCGSGIAGYSGDGAAATAAVINLPAGACTDLAGNVYIADMDNQRIRKITISTGIISTVAGNGTNGYTGDGTPATTATLSYPNGVCTDSVGNIYISDRGNSCIRKVDAATGIISTITGNGIQGYTGDYGPATAAQLRNPSGVWTIHGVVYIADMGNNVVRAITTAGNIYTVAGSGMYGYCGDGGFATFACMDDPINVWVDDANYIYIAELHNSVIRKISPPTMGIKTIQDAQEINIYPNPSSGHITLHSASNSHASVSVYNTLGQTIYSAISENEYTPIDLTGVAAGLYYVYFTTNEISITRKILIQY